jgi:hypothetical protein
VFPTHLNGVCDITRCLYDRALYNASATAPSRSAPGRLLAVADLQHHADFDLLFRMTEYRREHSWDPNSQEALNLTMSTVSYILNRPPPSPPTKEERVRTAEGTKVSLVIGVHSLYAAQMVETLLNASLPEWSIVHRYAIDYRALTSAGQDGWDVHTMDKNWAYGSTLDGVAVEQLAHTENTILVMGVLDCAERIVRAIDPSLQLQWTSASNDKVRAARLAVGAKRVVVVSGEPVDLSTVDNDLVGLLITATTRDAWLPEVVRHVYVPVLVTALFELNAHTAEQFAADSLLTSAAERCPEQQGFVETTDGTAVLPPGRRGGVAYLYHRCDRVLREKFFDALSNMLPTGTVEPLGRCQGASDSAVNTVVSAPSAASHRDTRFNQNYISEAVALYKDFKFVVAFENSAVEGYITEKLLTAFLAGAVPIYFGAPDVANYFNPAAIIHCGEYSEENLHTCAQRVSEVNHTPSMLQHILRQAPVVNITAWETLFPWEPAAVGSTSAEWVMRIVKESLVGLV